MTDIAKLLFEMRERPQDFMPGPYTLTHIPSRQRFWVSNGVGYYGLYEPVEMKFGFLDQRRFHRAWRAWRRLFLRNCLLEPAITKQMTERVR